MVLSVILRILILAAPSITMTPAGNTDARYSTINNVQGNIYHVQGNQDVPNSRFFNRVLSCHWLTAPPFFFFENFFEETRC